LSNNIKITCNIQYLFHRKLFEFYVVDHVTKNRSILQNQKKKLSHNKCIFFRVWVSSFTGILFLFSRSYFIQRLHKS